jgi:hypothetical protein
VETNVKQFLLFRKEDISGVSGTGYIAEGVEFHDHQCVLSWFGKHHSIEIHPSIDDLMAIHGHKGKTELVWRNDEEPESVH